MMKRSLSIVLLLALALTLCACGSSKPEATPAPVQEVSAQETPAESVPAEPAPAEEAAPDPAETLAEAAALFADGEYEQALALCEGVPGAAAILGKSRYLGLGCEVDHDRAVHDLEQAVEEGSVYSLYLLADAADKGNGTKQDKDEAARRFVKFVAAVDGLDASDPEYGPSMAALCDVYAKGRGVEQNDRLALDAAVKAASASGLSVFDRLGLASFLDSDSHSAVDRACAHAVRGCGKGAAEARGRGQSACPHAAGQSVSRRQGRRGEGL